METTAAPAGADVEAGGGGHGDDGRGNSDADDRPQRPSDVDGLTNDDRRRMRRAWAFGAVPTFLVYAWVLMAGRWAPLQVQYFDNFFDAQARALFDGRLDVPPEVVGFEGFLIDGKTYIYFGPFPSLLRMPIMALTDRFDGRLTTLSMLGAMAVLAWAAFRLSCVVRAMVRGAVPVGRREALATGVLAVGVLASPPLFLASAAVVYHEAALWGVALSVLGYDAALRWQRAPSLGRLATASLVITAAILSRQTLALGALATLGVAALTMLAVRWRTSWPSPERRRRLLLRTVPALALAGLVPLAASSALNHAKLGQLFGLPMDKQLQSIMTDDRQDVIEANATFVGLEYVSTTASQYLRPDGIDVRQDFPWIDFPRYGPELVDESATFDELDWSSSLPATAPVLTVLTLAGLAWSVRSRRSREHRDRLTPLWVGSLVGGVSVLAFGYIANRYLNDLYPLALAGGLVGFHAAGRASAGWRPWLRRTLMGGAGVLVALGGLANVALAMEYQRERGPAVRESWRSEWVRWRLSLPGARSPLAVGRDEALPPVADGALIVVGDCDGLYVGVDDRWQPVERGPGAGVHDVSLDVDELPLGERVPLLTFGSGVESAVVGIVRTDDGEVRLDVLGPDLRGMEPAEPAEGEEAGEAEEAEDVGPPEWQLGTPLRATGTQTFRASTDPRLATANVSRDDLVLNAAALPKDVEGDMAVALGEAPDRGGVATSSPVPIERVEPDTPVCDLARD
jgi:hypothetical protein